MELLRKHPVALLLVAVMLLIGMVGLVRSVVSWQTLQGLIERGASGEGVLTEKVNPPFSAAYYLVYSYEVAGKTYTTQEQVPRRRYAAAQPGDRLVVRYDSADPLLVTLEGNTAPLTAFTLTSIGWLLAGGLCWAAYAAYLRRVRRALERSQALWDNPAIIAATLRFRDEINAAAAPPRDVPPGEEC